MTDSDDSTLLGDARAISTQWRSQMDLATMTDALLAEAGLRSSTLDVVAIGKASREMTAAVEDSLGERVRRRVMVCDIDVARGSTSPDVVVGEHPVPGPESLRAGAAVLHFLDQPTDADATNFLISGGASSLCVVPADPLTLGDLHQVWELALRAGSDITTLNMIRAASSLVAGGAVLRHVRTPRSTSFILVDNVISGARWVASSMTYDYQPSEEEVARLFGEIGVADPALRDRLLEGFRTRAAAMATPVSARHENRVLAEPAQMLTLALTEARRRGYHVIDMGARVSGDVSDIVREWSAVMASAPSGPVALVGVGEVTVRVSGSGRGGRCQEFAWLMADVLAWARRPCAFVAQASDGRDHLEGVAGAWVDDTTRARLVAAGLDWETVRDSHDTYPALHALGNVIEGAHTGWNLCDLYVATLE